MKYSICKLAIMLLQIGLNGSPCPVRFNKTYILQWQKWEIVHYGYITVECWKYVSLKNCQAWFKELSFNWRDGISDDALRIALKRTFFWQHSLIIFKISFIFLTNWLVLFDYLLNVSSILLLIGIFVHTFIIFLVEGCELMKRFPYN